MGRTTHHSPRLPASSPALAALALTALALTVLAPSRAAADRLVPAIEAGREADIVALVAPYAVPGTVTPGWRLVNVRVEAHAIRYELAGPDGAAALVLTHPDAAGGGGAPSARSASFAFRREPAGPNPALDALVAAVVLNDDGGFWQADVVPQPPDGPGAAPAGATGPGPIGALLGDGILHLAFVVLALALLLAADLRSAGWALRAALAAVVVIGVVVRLVISVETTLVAFPYLRTPALAEAVFEGPVLGWITAWTGAVEEPDVIFRVGLLVSALTPAAVFAYARRLFRGDLVALVAAGIVAVLPIHLRFARSDTQLVQSVLYVTLALALLHAALDARARRWGLLAGAAFALAAAALYPLRPLDLLALPLFLWTALVVARGAPWPRRLALAALACGALVVVLVAGSSNPIGGDTGADWLPSLRHLLVGGPLLFLDPSHNTLVNPWITPPGLAALALGGLALLAWQREWSRLLLLAGWLFGYFWAHTLVLAFAVYLQARYHLHLVVPFVLLAAVAIAGLFQVRRLAGFLVLAYVAASPLVHADFIRDTDFNEQREYAFLRALRPLVPPDCTILEYTGPEEGTRFGSAFRRVGGVRHGSAYDRWPVVPTGAPVPGRDAPASADPITAAARATVAAPPACLLYYEGVSCWSRKDMEWPFAPACAAARRDWTLLPLHRRRFESRCFDERQGTEYCQPGHELTLTLYRVAPPE